MFRRISLLAVLTAAGLALAAPSGAAAATNLGETFTPSPTLCNLTNLQTTSPNGQYTVPFAGVITSWSYQALASPPNVNFKVGRSAGGNSFTIVGESGPTIPTAGILNTRTTRISVNAGDVIGIYGNAEGTCTIAGGYTAHSASGDRLLGDTTTYALEPSRKLNVAATLEADSDKDGFGDETQDQCATSGSTQGACPVTPATPAKKKKCKKKKKRAAFTAKKKCKKKK